jgi:hypothetical protein
MKKIVFGSILAAFLLVSTGFIIPIQVQAVEIEAKDIWNDICDLADDIVSNQEFIDLLNSNNLTSFFEEYNSGDITAEEYVDKVTDSSEFSIIEDMADRYSPRLEQLNNTFSSWLSNIDIKSYDSNEINGEKYYRIYEENNEYRINRQDSDEITDGILVIITDSISLKTVSGSLDDILSFLEYLLIVIERLMGISWHFALCLMMVLVGCGPLLNGTELEDEYVFVLIFLFLYLYGLYMPIWYIFVYFPVWLIYKFLEEISEYFENDDKSVESLTIFERINEFILKRFPNIFRFLQRMQYHSLAI